MFLIRFSTLLFAKKEKSYAAWHRIFCSVGSVKRREVGFEGFNDHLIHVGIAALNAAFARFETFFSVVGLHDDGIGIREVVVALVGIIDAINKTAGLAGIRLVTKVLTVAGTLFGKEKIVFAGAVMPLCRILRGQPTAGHERQKQGTDQKDMPSKAKSVLHSNSSIGFHTH